MTSARLTTTLALNKPLLSIYLTGGYPQLHATLELCEVLEQSGVDLIEIGFPYSDPLADGPTIQATNNQALKNGMSLPLLLQHLQPLRQKVQIPVLLMGYFNPVEQFGVENFLDACVQVGIDGIILPDLPLELYETRYRQLFVDRNLSFVPIITSMTEPQRLRRIDALATSFIYAVSSAGVTGGSITFDTTRQEFLTRVAAELTHPVLVGFGIDSHESFHQACKSARGAIIGSAFLKALGSGSNFKDKATEFVREILG